MTTTTELIVELTKRHESAKAQFVTARRELAERDERIAQLRAQVEARTADIGNLVHINTVLAEKVSSLEHEMIANRPPCKDKDDQEANHAEMQHEIGPLQEAIRQGNYYKRRVDSITAKLVTIAQERDELREKVTTLETMGSVLLEQPKPEHSDYESDGFISFCQRIVRVPITGIMDPVTTNAIAAWKIGHGLPYDGHADDIFVTEVARCCRLGTPQLNILLHIVANAVNTDMVTNEIANIADAYRNYVGAQNPYKVPQ
jgi:peptidoglycan hydrolase-like protein with peptidoglycan-binding domain